MVINCEGWACTIVKDFDAEKTKTTKRSRGGGGIFYAEKTKTTKSRGGGMYSSSEKTESRTDSPVIFVVCTNIS